MNEEETQITLKFNSDKLNPKFVEYRFMTIIKVYPNGKTYVNSFLLDHQLRELSKGRKAKQRKLPVKTTEVAVEEI